MIILYIIFSPRIENTKNLDSLGLFGILDHRVKRQIYGVKRQIYGVKRQIYGTAPTNLRSRGFQNRKTTKLRRG